MAASKFRTPRRRKIWIGKHVYWDMTTGSAPEVLDLFGTAFTELGVANLAGLTVMRCVGELQLVAWTSASTAAYAEVRVGATWMDQALALTSGTAIPLPLVDGSRATNWYQQWQLGGSEVSSTPIVGGPIEPIERSLIKDIDVHHMQKSPNANSQFKLIANPAGTWEADTVRLRVDLDFLVALP